MEENSTIDFDYSSYHCKFRGASNSPEFTLEDKATIIRITHTAGSEKGVSKLDFECRISQRVPVIKGGSIETLIGELVETLKVVTVEVIAQ